MTLSKTYRKKWLVGRKLHGVIGWHPACRPDMSLAAGYPVIWEHDLRKITCKSCKKVIRKFRDS